MEKITAAVVFHSVCANTYLMAEKLRRSLEEQGIEVLFFRLYDPNYAVTADAFAASREYKEAITAVPLLESPRQILDCDGLFLGSPTYFGNVSAPVKYFMDSFVDCWSEARLAGKVFGCFATSGTPQGGCDLCLQAMNCFAQHMGMLCLSIPSILEGRIQPAYGLAHYSGDLSDVRPNDQDYKALDSFAAYAAGIIGALKRGREAGR